jgi:hypothetical protein
MNVEDALILERVERLAFQAGVASRGEGQSKPKPEIENLFRKLKKVSENNSTMTGDCLFATSSSNNLNWEDIRAAVAVM